MRMIAKTELGMHVLNRQKQIGIPQTATEARDRWQSFASKKSKVRNALKREQKGLCGYTEFNIDHFKSTATLSSRSDGCHIEHIKPKSVYPQETFDYKNLLLSILHVSDEKLFERDTFVDGAPEDDNSHRKFFGGSAKNNIYDEELFISPINNACNYFFTFLEQSGEIVPSASLENSDRDKALYTINLLNLNHPYLKNQRRKRMIEVLDDIDELSNRNTIQRIIEEEISEDDSNQIASFPSAVSSLIN